MTKKSKKSEPKIDPRAFAFWLGVQEHDKALTVIATKLKDDLTGSKLAGIGLVLYAAHLPLLPVAKHPELYEELMRGVNDLLTTISILVLGEAQNQDAAMTPADLSSLIWQTITSKKFNKGLPK